MQCFYSLLAAFKILLLSLVFSVKHLGGGGGVRVLLRVCRTSWICGLAFFIIFGKTLGIISSSPCFFPVNVFPSSLPRTPVTGSVRNARVGPPDYVSRWNRISGFQFFLRFSFRLDDFCLKFTNAFFCGLHCCNAPRQDFHSRRCLLDPAPPMFPIHALTPPPSVSCCPDSSCPIALRSPDMSDPLVLSLDCCTGSFLEGQCGPSDAWFQTSLGACGWGLPAGRGGLLSLPGPGG